MAMKNSLYFQTPRLLKSKIHLDCSKNVGVLASNSRMQYHVPLIMVLTPDEWKVQHTKHMRTFNTCNVQVLRGVCIWGHIQQNTVSISEPRRYDAHPVQGIPQARRRRLAGGSRHRPAHETDGNRSTDLHKVMWTGCPYVLCRRVCKHTRFVMTLIYVPNVMLFLLKSIGWYAPSRPSPP